MCDTTIESIAYWTIVDEWVTIDHHDGKIYGGAGQMGNEGFIACTKAEDRLVWGIFLNIQTL
ncbi:hypothetical protein NV377_04755 [Paenibacillus sp. T3-5-0-4]|nr:hypothetical protein [Paenibacillus endoradicis]